MLKANLLDCTYFLEALEILPEVTVQPRGKKYGGTAFGVFVRIIR